MVTRVQRLRLEQQALRARIPELIGEPEIKVIEPMVISPSELRSQQIQKDISKIQIEQDQERERRIDLQQRLQTLRESGTSTSAERGALDDRIGDSTRLIQQLEKAKANVRSGFTFESSVSVATQTVVAKSRIREIKREIKKELAVPLKERVEAVELPPREVTPEKKPVTIPFIRPETVKFIDLPAIQLGRIPITFGQAEKFGRSFFEATGKPDATFTIAVPIRRQEGKLFVQDFNFRFKNGKLVKFERTGSALITEEQFRAADKRRRDRNPGFTFGDTRQVLPVLDIREPAFERVITQAERARRLAAIGPPTIFRIIKGKIIPPEGQQKLNQKISDIKIAINNIRQGFVELFVPEVKKERIANEKDLQALETQGGKLELEVGNFRQRFGGKELSQKDFEKATAEQNRLNIKIDNFNQKIKDTEKRIRARSPKSLAELEGTGFPGLRGLGREITTGFGIGLVSVPFAAAEFAVEAGVKGTERATIELLAGFAEVPKQFREAPGLTIGEFAGQIAFFEAGRIIGGRIFGKNIPKTKITEAIDRASVRSRVVGKNLDVIKFYKLPESIGKDIKVFVDKGFTVSGVQTRIVGRTTADAKLIPDIRGNFIEVIARDGRIVERIDLGNVQAVQRGKTFIRDVVVQATGIIEEQKALNFFTRTTSGIPTRGGFKDIRQIKTLEEITFPRKELAEVEVGLVRPEILAPDIKTLIREAKKVKEPLSASEILIGTKLERARIDITRVQRRVGPVEVGFGDFVTVARLEELRALGFGETITGRALSKAEIRQAKAEQIRQRRVAQQTKKELEEFNKRINKISGLEILTPQQIAVQFEKLPRITTGLEEITKQVAKQFEFEVFQQPAFTPVVFDVTTRQAALSLLGFDEKTLQQQLVLQDKALADLGKFGDVQIPALGITQVPEFRLAEGMALTQIQAPALKQGFATAFGIGAPIPGVPKVPIIPPIIPPKKERIPKAEREMEIFDAWIKSEGRRKKVADNILEQEALDLGGFVVDNSLSAEFSIKGNQKGKRKKVPINVQQDFFKFNQGKFRDFKIKKGRKISTPNTFTEKRQFRLDTPGEVNKITAARLISNRKKIDKGFATAFGVGSPVKKKKRRIRAKKK